MFGIGGSARAVAKMPEKPSPLVCSRPSRARERRSETFNGLLVPKQATVESENRKKKLDIQITKYETISKSVLVSYSGILSFVSVSSLDPRASKFKSISLRLRLLRI